MLEARKIDASGGKLTSEVAGEIEVEDKVLMIKRIHVHYRLQADPSEQETIERAHERHADRCPVARSIRDAIEVSTSYELV